MGIYREEVVAGVNTSEKHAGIRRLCALVGPHLDWDHHLEWWRASFPALTPPYHSRVEESVAEARMACGASWLWSACVDYNQSIRGTSQNLNVTLHLQVHFLFQMLQQCSGHFVKRINFCKASQWSKDHSFRPNIVHISTFLLWTIFLIPLFQNWNENKQGIKHLEMS